MINITSFIKKEISRRDFLRRLRNGAGIIGLSPLSAGLSGCQTEEGSPSLSFEKELIGNVIPNLLFGNELVGNVTSNSATIRLVAGESCQASTKFKLFYDTESRSDVPLYRHHSPAVSRFNPFDPITFGLSSLSDNTRYYYRLGYNDGNGWVYRNEYSFRTQRPAGENFRFCIAADTHISQVSNLSNHGVQVYKNILADDPDLLLTLGDEAILHNTRNPNPEYSYFLSEDSMKNIWRDLRKRLDEACHSMFHLPVLGNHEGLMGWTTHLDQYAQIVNMRDTFLLIPDNDTFLPGGDDIGRYGAFTWGDVLFIWLDTTGFCDRDPIQPGNSNADYILGDAQRNFLQTTLEENQNIPWKFVFAHHIFGGNDACEALIPKYGRGNANGAYQYDQLYIQELMEEYGAQAFFYGHDHAFSVSEASLEPDKKVAYICTGHAGSACPWHLALERCYEPYENFFFRGGHVRVDVTPLNVTVSYIRASTNGNNGTVVSSYQL